MITLPPSDEGLFIRSDFSNNTVWEQICNEINENEFGLPPMLMMIDDEKYNALKIESLPRFDIDQIDHTFILVVDEESIRSEEHSILFVDLNHEFLRSFRVIPSEIFAVTANLGLAHMDFFDFANNVDHDGIFRGFKNQ